MSNYIDRNIARLQEVPIEETADLSDKPESELEILNVSAVSRYHFSGNYLQYPFWESNYFDAHVKAVVTTEA